MADIINTCDYKLGPTGAKADTEDNGQELSSPNDPFNNQDGKVELERLYAVHAKTFRFFKGIGGQIISVLNTPNITPKSIEQYLKQVNSLLSVLAKLELSIRMFNMDTFYKTYETKINQIIAYMQNEMIVDDVKIVSCQLFDLLEKSEQAFAKELEDLKRQEEEEGQKRMASEEAKRKAWIIEMVEVEGGTFTMGATPEQGSDCYCPEKPAHQVTLSSFNIGKYPVTQAQWKAVMGKNPSYFEGDNLPVETVSWEDVQIFIRLLNRSNAAAGKKYRLPTEAEWEYAARGGRRSKGYKYSGSDNLNDVAWYEDNSGNTTHPVGAKSPNELGIYDMNGNVWEWCQNRFSIYCSKAQTNPKGPRSLLGGVTRGGSWNCFARNCRVSIRCFSSNKGRNNFRGFRLASDP